jgi:hypothetical protein
LFGPEREAFLVSVYPILEAPRARTGRVDERKRDTGVSEILGFFEGLAARMAVSVRGMGEGPRSGVRPEYPKKSPQISPAANEYPRTAPDISGTISLANLRVCRRRWPSPEGEMVPGEDS